MEHRLQGTIRICEDRIRQLEKLITFALRVKVLRPEGQVDFITDSIRLFIQEITDLDHFRISFQLNNREKYYIAKKGGSLIFAETPSSKSAQDEDDTIKARKSESTMARLLAELIVSSSKAETRSSQISIKASYAVPEYAQNVGGLQARSS